MAAEDYSVAEWLKDQQRLAEAERTGRGVIVMTSKINAAGVREADEVYGPVIVIRSAHGQVSLRVGSVIRTFWLKDIESVSWAPPVVPR